MLTFYFTGVEGSMTVPELLTAGMVGKELRLEFSEEWENLAKTVVFSNGETTLDRLYTGETMVIPAQVLEKPLEQLTVGLYGVSEEGLLVIPTVRAEGPVILPGVDPSGDPGVDPSLPVWAQLREMVEKLEQLAAAEKEELLAVIEELSRRVEKCPGAEYYGSLADAISDVNNGVTACALAERAGAKVAVFVAPNGTKTVMLLDDVSENAEITVNKDIDLVLNGKILNLMTPASVLAFGAGTKCRINGEIPGSAVVKELSDATASTSVITVSGDELRINGGRYVLSGSNSGYNMAVKVTNTCKMLEMTDAVVESSNAQGFARCVQSQSAKTVLNGCNFSVDGQTQADNVLSATDLRIEGCSMTAYGRTHKATYCVANQGFHTEINNSNLRAVVTNEGEAYAACSYDGTEVIISNSVLTGDARDCHASATSRAYAMRNLGTTILNNVTAFGTHSAISTSGNAYINGGVYTGFCHGGVYVFGSKKAVCSINDATLSCGNYEGEFDYSGKTEEIYGSMYIGGSAEANGLTAYLDGCTIANEGGHPIVMRGTDGEQNNTVYISNSTVLGTIRIDNDTLKLYVGTGTHIEAYKIDTPSRAEFTRKLYRKNSAEKPLDGCDYDALAVWLEKYAGLVKSVGGIAADENGNVPLAWVATDDFRTAVILEETAVSSGFTSAFGYDDLYGQEELAVLCDGRLYLCVPEFGYSEGDGYYVYVGNKCLLSESQTDTGEPFLVWGNKGARLILNFRESGSHMLSVTGYRHEFTKLPAKYLPEDAIRQIVESVLAEN